MGDRLIEFEPQGGVTSTPLPTVSGGYSGSTAENTQACVTLPNGEILFFVVDGNIYDNEGYLIADTEGPGCTECVPRGTTKFLPMLVPGSCTLYYLFTGTPRIYPSVGELNVGLLDILAPNPHYPGCGRRGRLIDLENDAGLGTPYEVLGNWANSFLGGNPYFPNIAPNGVSIKTSTLDIAAMDPQWTSGPLAGNQIVHFTTVDRVYQFHATATGVEWKWTYDLLPLATSLRIGATIRNSVFSKVQGISCSA
jgi:hypothetical protein